jgi:transposase
MIKMDTKQEILRRYFRECDSERKIARDLQLNRKTVKKYLEEYLQAKKKSEEEGTKEILQDYSTSPPDYNTCGRVKRKLTLEIAAIIREQVEENERKRRSGLRKQVKRKIDIHEYLLSLGYQIGYTTVCNHIRNQEVSDREAYIRQVYIPGEECEFDWAETKLTIGGVQRRFFLAVFTSSYGNYRFARLYSRQDTLSFMESHNDFFAHIGGVFHEMVYDNMRVAIAEFTGRNEKQPTTALSNLAGWFQFRWRFCNVCRGNEKGHVERSVEFVRRKAFSNRDSFESLDQAQDHLMSTLEKLNRLTGSSTGKSPLMALTEERPHLWKYPGEMECYLVESLKVDKYATFSYGTNRYSVPDYLVGRMVDVKVYSNRLKVYHNNLNLCSHQRNYGTFQWKIEIDHYLVTLSRKPGAVHGSVALEQSPPVIRWIYHHYFENQPREFIDILLYCKNNSIAHDNLEDTVSKVNRLCPGDVSADKVIALLGNQPETESGLPAETKKTDEIEDLSFKQLQEITLLAECRLNYQMP